VLVSHVVAHTSRRQQLLQQHPLQPLALRPIWNLVSKCSVCAQIYNMMDGDDREPGDFGFDPLKLLKGNEEQYKLAELTHGRAAMLAFSAVVTQSALPSAFGYGKETFPYF